MSEKKTPFSDDGPSAEEKPVAKTTIPLPAMKLEILEGVHRAMHMLGLRPATAEETKDHSGLFVPDAPAPDEQRNLFITFKKL